jgi:hypothetical protein
MKIQIASIFGSVLFEGDFECLADAVKAAVKAKADLSYANLSYANLSYANLRSADLSYANLSYANLRSADLSYANLRSADLRSANLRSADLSYADLSYAKINWQSHECISELLRVAAGLDHEKRKIAGLILVSRDWCWDDFIALKDPLMGWAIDELAKHVVDGDGAPELLANRAAKSEAVK